MYAGGGDCKAAVELWMTEERNYRGQAIGGSDLSLIGHFTQVMWKSTESVGCGRVGGVVTCRYYPAGKLNLLILGNMVGETPY